MCIEDGGSMHTARWEDKGRQRATAWEHAFTQVSGRGRIQAILVDKTDSWMSPWDALARHKRRMGLLVLYLDHGGGGGEWSPVSQTIFPCRQ